MKTILTTLGVSLLVLAGCTGQKQAESNFIQENIDNAVAQETIQTDIIEKSGKILNPRTINADGSISYIPIDDWCSGFFPGSMWLTYNLTGDKKWLPLAEKYTEENPEFAMRLKVKAGITGFAQVYGRYNTPAIEKAQMDAYYIRKASVLMDLRLILATVKVLFMKESSEGVVTESKTENRAENKAYKMIKERETA